MLQLIVVFILFNIFHDSTYTLQINQIDEHIMCICYISNCTTVIDRALGSTISMCSNYLSAMSNERLAY